MVPPNPGTDPEPHVFVDDSDKNVAGPIFPFWPDGRLQSLFPVPPLEPQVAPDSNANI